MILAILAALQRAIDQHFNCNNDKYTCNFKCQLYTLSDTAKASIDQCGMHYLFFRRPTNLLSVKLSETIVTAYPHRCVVRVQDGDSVALADGPFNPRNHRPDINRIAQNYSGFEKKRFISRLTENMLRSYNSDVTKNY